MARDRIASYAASQNAAPPARLGQRYDADRFLPEPGNTVVCHLDTRAPGHEAVLTARERMRALPGAEGLLFTPASSLHMTVFEGVIETRRTEDAWPAGVDRDAPVETVTEILADRLQGFVPPPGFSVRATGLLPTGLALAGATPEDEHRMRQWRDALVAPFGYRHSAHDSYGFHMTFAYPVRWLPDEAVPQWQATCQDILQELWAAAPVLPLRPPAFCTFEDMTAFPERLTLAPAGV